MLSVPGVVHGGLHAFPPFSPQTNPTREVLLVFPFLGENLGLKRLNNSIKEVVGPRLDPRQCDPKHEFKISIRLP